MPGDKITRINNRKISAYRDIQLYTLSHPGQELTISYERPAGGSWENKGAAEKRTAVLTPAFNEEYQAYMLGVLFAGYEKTDSFAELIRCSAYEVKYCIVSTFDSLRMLFTKQLPVEDAVTGPVGIVSMVGETVEQGRDSGKLGSSFKLQPWNHESVSHSGSGRRTSVLPFSRTASWKAHGSGKRRNGSSGRHDGFDGTDALCSLS